jgi:hypothetical protein
LWLVATTCKARGLYTEWSPGLSTRALSAANAALSAVLPGTGISVKKVPIINHRLACNEEKTYYFLVGNSGRGQAEVVAQEFNKAMIVQRVMPMIQGHNDPRKVASCPAHECSDLSASPSHRPQSSLFIPTCLHTCPYRIQLSGTIYLQLVPDV